MATAIIYADNGEKVIINGITEEWKVYLECEERKRKNNELRHSKNGNRKRVYFGDCGKGEIVDDHGQVVQILADERTPETELIKALEENEREKLKARLPALVDKLPAAQKKAVLAVFSAAKRKRSTLRKLGQARRTLHR